MRYYETGVTLGTGNWSVGIVLGKILDSRKIDKFPKDELVS